MRPGTGGSHRRGNAGAAATAVSRMAVHEPCPLAPAPPCMPGLHARFYALSLSCQSEQPSLRVRWSGLPASDWRPSSPSPALPGSSRAAGWRLSAPPCCCWRAWRRRWRRPPPARGCWARRSSRPSRQSLLRQTTRWARCWSALLPQIGPSFSPPPGAAGRLICGSAGVTAGQACHARPPPSPAAHPAPCPQAAGQRCVAIPCYGP